MPMYWTQESLWAKAQVYAQRADAEERDGPLFAFWSHLTLELLLRAALANVHPALLADRGKSAKSLMYALEIGLEGDPRSIQTGELVNLCTEVLPDFTSEHATAALAMAARRNREVHTGEPAFENLPLGAWLADYYRVAEVLLAGQDLELADLIGLEEAAAARTMVDALQARVQKQVLDRVSAARRTWSTLPEEDRRARRAAARARKVRAAAKISQCPACESRAAIVGEQVVVGQTRLEASNELIEEVRMLPVRMECVACGLRLTGHAELHVVELGGQFTLLREVDPVEFHGIEIDDYVDPDRYIAIPDGPEYEDE